MTSTTHRARALACGVATLAASGVASAQGLPPPPPGFEAPPGYPIAVPAYGPPPPGYAVPYHPQAPLAPKVMDYEGGPVPPGYHVATRARKGFIVAGAVTFGTLYLFSALGAAAAQDAKDEGFTPLYAPCVGPFVAMGTADVNATGAFALAVDGVAQSAGAAMLLFGLLAPQTKLVRNDAAVIEIPAPVAFGRSGYGLGVAGAL
jgi:hypothetical protein